MVAAEEEEAEEECQISRFHRQISRMLAGIRSNNNNPITSRKAATIGDHHRLAVEVAAVAA